MAARTTGLSDYYRENGYVIVRGLVPTDYVDALLDCYRGDILANRNKFFRQSTDQYEANKLTASGFVRQSFLDIHAYERYPRFREHALSIFFHQAMLDALAQITGSQAHNLMQSMLFDANTATPPHQDWWYLDSVPSGHLLAAWMALEDIDERAGRFFVVPKSHGMVLHEPGLAHSIGSCVCASFAKQIRSASMRRNCARAMCCSGTREPCTARCRRKMKSTRANRSRRTICPRR